MFSKTIHDLARKIKVGGFRWVEDGPTIREIIREVDAFSAPLLETAGLTTDKLLAARRAAAYTALDLLDTLYGWDAARMDEAQERAFYRQIVQWELT